MTTTRLDDCTAMAHLKDFVIHDYPLVFMGEGKGGGQNYPAGAKPKLVWNKFAAKHPDLIPQEKNSKTGPGQNNPLFARFRDVWLLQALREVHAEAKGKPVDDVPAAEYIYKTEGQYLKSGERVPRRVKDWQVLTEKNKHLRFLLALPAAYEKEGEVTDDAASSTAPSTRVDETEMWPPCDDAAAEEAPAAAVEEAAAPAIEEAPVAAAPVAADEAPAAAVEEAPAPAVEEAPAPKKKRKTKADAVEDAFKIVWEMHEAKNISVDEHIANEETIRAFVTDPVWEHTIKGVAKWTDEQCHTSYAQWYNSHAHGNNKRRKRA